MAPLTLLTDKNNSEEAENTAYLTPINASLLEGIVLLSQEYKACLTLEKIWLMQIVHTLSRSVKFVINE